MATRFYMSRTRWIAALVLLAAALLFWWAVGIRLADSAKLEEMAMRQEALQFKITNLRWQRDELDTAELKEVRELAALRLLQDPEGLPGFLDHLQDMAEARGIDLAISLADRQPFDNMERLFTRQVNLSFSTVPYDQLEAYLGELEQQSANWHFLLGDFSFANRGSEPSVTGKLEMKIWTTFGKPADQDTLF